MSSGRPPTEAQLARERSLVLAIGFDTLLIVPAFFVGIIGGSLTLLAECVRGVLMMATELFSLVALRLIHRGQLTKLEFGVGKLEQLSNLGIAGGMLIGAAWICFGAIHLALGDTPPGSPAGLALAAVFCALNTYLNFLSWAAVRRTTAGGASIIMESQLRSRFVKLCSSVVVLVLLTVSAIFPDPVIATWADVAGSLFVAAFIVLNAVEMIRGGLPDLLDNSVNEAVQQGINRALARHFEDYDYLERVRSRRSGNTVFVEVALGFEPDLTLSEVDRRTHRLKETIGSEIEHADVSILISALKPRA